MQYTTRREITLATVLAKLQGVKYSAANPVTYAPKDAKAAKAVLQRLITKGNDCAVSSIKEQITQNNEV